MRCAESGTRARQPERARCAGFTYLGLLVFIAVLGLGLAATGVVWHTSITREKERELLFIGDEFQRAIGLYYARNGDDKTNPLARYPRALEDLLEDRNKLPHQHYLRKIYRDPMTGTKEWGLIVNEAGGITGVYSLGAGEPLKRTGFPEPLAEFAGAATYADWKFVARPPAQEVVQAAAPPPAGKPHIPAPTPHPAPLPTPRREPRKLDCAKVNQQDMAACESQRVRWGEETVTQCQLSAALRLSACSRGETVLPQLYIRYQ
jgi:type II secretory pathway pseudopilin PulG